VSPSHNYRRAYRDAMRAGEREAIIRQAVNTTPPRRARWRLWLAVAALVTYFTAALWLALQGPWFIADLLHSHLR